MAKRYVHNDTDLVRFIGGTMLQPGEGREVDEQFLPPGDEAAAADAATGEVPSGAADPDAAALQANLAEMLAQPLKTLMPLLKEASDETLAGLQQLEVAAATPRVTLLNAIGELQLLRAQVRAGAAD